MHCVAIITAPHGIRGKCKIKSLIDDLSSILAHTPLTDGTIDYHLYVQSQYKDVLLVHIRDIDSREQASALVGKKLYLNELPKLQEDEFYASDLENLEVRESNGKVYGKVSNTYNFGGGDILEIMPANTAQSVLLPFTHEIFPVIVKNKYIVLHHPEIVE